jgi:2-polyprenyl-3-methyl-5-hydroxy-6-metoxy-1,4-benzoquinol methylase
VNLSGPMIELARARRQRPNISYRRADLHDVGAPGRYDFILSVLALHHVPDRRDALHHVKTLAAPVGRAVLVDIACALVWDVPGGSAGSPVGG